MRMRLLNLSGLGLCGRPRASLLRLPPLAQQQQQHRPNRKRRRTQSLRLVIRIRSSLASNYVWIGWHPARNKSKVCSLKISAARNSRSVRKIAFFGYKFGLIVSKDRL